MSYIFISDLHLDETRPDITQAFLHFLENTAVNAERLYILGDFFEVWLGDDDNSPFNQSIISALASLPMPRFIMHGNRDFLIGQRFCEQTGFELLTDPTRLTFFDRPVLLMHGDSLCTRDEEYMKVRAMARYPDFKAELLSKSLEERAAIAASARTQSKDHTRETAMDIMDVTPSEVVKVMREQEVPLLIHGHTHRPQVHEVPEARGQRVVLGDWNTKGWYLEMDKSGFSLQSFPIS
ncbi:MAG TPA: UDP-2,3-diacylglucosamine diphosphatase [Gammaproteobacteria bacterium]|nr:UDP-2,3-diacylglucosamine diphosphatase [Gammaproteobacteria bacterium]